jgi:hypothetical protein
MVFMPAMGKDKKRLPWSTANKRIWNEIRVMEPGLLIDWLCRVLT